MTTQGIEAGTATTARRGAKHESPVGGNADAPNTNISPPEADIVERGWQPIETAPKDGTIFWALEVHPNARFRPESYEARYVTASLLCTLLSEEQNPRCHNLSANKWGKPTHWMPSLAPPAIRSLTSVDRGVTTAEGADK